MQEKAQAVQKALEFDLKIIGDVARMDAEERMLQKQKKEELRNEVQKYREYLQKQKLAEQQAAKEIDTMYHEEIEKRWLVKEQKWAEEQKARDRLMAEVLATRQEQIREKRNFITHVSTHLFSTFEPTPTRNHSY
jgi:hypothetical protein